MSVEGEITSADTTTRQILETEPGSNAAELFVKAEENLDESDHSSLASKIDKQGEKRKMSQSPSPVNKRAKAEPEVDEWDDGGIADDDLAGL